MSDGPIAGEARRRRTFAIISHPDAGKTTLTEKLLLLGGVLREAGQVQARSGRRAAVSDWMELEQTRGISVTSTVLRFEHGDTVLNLLDTPGHRDFSEDTMRVLSAADCAVVLLDAARGVQEQTRMLFEVARARRMPILTFVNKFDRPGMGPLGMLDHIESELGLTPAPLTWPVGEGPWFEGLIDRRRDRAVRLVRRPHGAQAAEEHEVDLAAVEGEGAWATAAEEVELVTAAGSAFSQEEFLAGRLTPVLFGSAMWTFGVGELLRAVVELAPPPQPRTDVAGGVRPVDAPFSAQVFKVQANTDPRHRDRLAFLRVCSGRFERGMRAVNLRSGRPVSLAHAHDVLGRERGEVLEAWPGDVVGVSNVQDLRVGDTLSEDAAAAPLRAIPTLVPQRLVKAYPRDTARRKQFVRGLQQLDEEGVVHVLQRTSVQDPVPVLGAVGDLQLEVLSHRMGAEMNCPVRLEPSPWTVARRLESDHLDALLAMRSAEALRRADGTILAAFPDPYRLNLFVEAHPDARLTQVLGDVPPAVVA